jgi:hydrogenase maturation protease
VNVAVVALGNVLMGDDAFGAHVLRQLQDGWSFPREVEVQDLGTPGLDLTPYVEGLDALIVVDCVRADGPPGTLRCWDRAGLLALPPQPRLSPHDPGLKEALLIAEFCGKSPGDVLLVGVVPGSTGTGIGLGAEVREAVPRAARLVLDELARLGFEAVPRPQAVAAPGWWEEPVGALRS